MSDAPDTRPVSATRRMARTLARAPRNPAFCWFLIGAGALIYLVSLFTTAVEFQTTPDRGWGMHSWQRLDGWDCFLNSISHLGAFLTGSECRHPRYKGWAALAGAANLVFPAGVLVVVFARTRRQCGLTTCAVGTAAAGVVLVIVGVYVGETLNGWTVRLTDGAGLWALAFLFVAFGTFLRWLVLSPERIEKRRLEKMGRMERHGV